MRSVRSSYAVAILAAVAWVAPAQVCLKSVTFATPSYLLNQVTVTVPFLIL